MGEFKLREVAKNWPPIPIPKSKLLLNFLPFSRESRAKFTWFYVFFCCIFSRAHKLLYNVRVLVSSSLRFFAIFLAIFTGKVSLTDRYRETDIVASFSFWLFT